jgi:hypothetical protein
LKDERAYGENLQRTLAQNAAAIAETEELVKGLEELLEAEQAVA